MELTLIALAVGLGLDWGRAAVLVGVVVAPLILFAVVVVVGVRLRPRRDLDAALFCDAVSAELRSGANLKEALAVSSPGIDTDGLTAPELGSRIAGVHTDIGEEIVATVGAAARGGSRVADLFDEMGSVALATAEMRREVRVATAPARVTVVVFLLAPVAFFLIRLRSGGLAQLLSSPDQRGMATLGLVLFLVGMAAAFAVAWRAR